MILIENYIQKSRNFKEKALFNQNDLIALSISKLIDISKTTTLSLINNKNKS